MYTTLLFEDLPEVPATAPKGGAVVGRRVIRVLEPNRAQIELRPSDLESVLPEGHRARMVWDFVGGQNLDALYAGIKAVEASLLTEIDPGYAQKSDPTVAREMWSVLTV